MSEPEEEDFATMFEASQKARRIEKGRTIEGTVVAIGAESALVDVGGKSEAEIDIDELKDDDGDVEVAVGDRIQATVVSTAGKLQLSRKLALRAATAHQVEDAFRAGLPVEGKVEGEVKGGYEVRVARQRAFCPVSQIDIIRSTDAAQHIGRVYRFLITEYKEGGRNIVVSRRVLLEREQQAQAAEAPKVDRRRCGDHRTRRVGPRLRRVCRARRRHPGIAARVGDGMDAHRRSVAGDKARR